MSAASAPSAAGFAFLLNLDPERELAGRSRDPFRALEDRPALRDDLARLTGDALVLVRDGVAKKVATGRRGLAFMPTPAAIAALAAAGATPPRAPPLDVLARVNHRGFSYGLRGSIGAIFARVEDVARALEAPRDVEAMLLKRPFGWAGRGRRRATRLDAATEAFCRRAIDEEGAVAVEPLFDRTLDAAIHGFVDERGVLTRGEPTIARVSGGGSFLGSARARGELAPDERAALLSEVEHVADALHAAGYEGPFGIDAFRHRDPVTGAPRFLARCEINARYTMGWAIGMAELRPDLVTPQGRNDDPTP